MGPLSVCSVLVARQFRTEIQAVVLVIFMIEDLLQILFEEVRSASKKPL